MLVKYFRYSVAKCFINVKAFTLIALCVICYDAFLQGYFTYLSMF